MKKILFVIMLVFTVTQTKEILIPFSFSSLLNGAN